MQHSTSVYFATRAIARGAAIITVDFDGGIVDEEVDGVVNNDVALPSFFSKSEFVVSILTSLPSF